MYSYLNDKHSVPQNSLVTSKNTRLASPLFMADEENSNPTGVERGVSMDQDGKSNVWAIEPKMEIENKSSEEKTGGAILAVGGFVAFAALAAGVLTNLPDPDQF